MFGSAEKYTLQSTHCALEWSDITSLLIIYYMFQSIAGCSISTKLVAKILQKIRIPGPPPPHLGLCSKNTFLTTSLIDNVPSQT